MMLFLEFVSFLKYIVGEGMVLFKNDYVLFLLNKKIVIFGCI